MHFTSLRANMSGGGVWMWYVLQLHPALLCHGWSINMVVGEFDSHDFKTLLAIYNDNAWLQRTIAKYRETIINKVKHFHFNEQRTMLRYVRMLKTQLSYSSFSGFLVYFYVMYLGFALCHVCLIAWWKYVKICFYVWYDRGKV